MQSKIMSNYIIEELIHFDCEDMNYFQNAFSSDVDKLVCDLDDEDSWCSVDSSTTEKPLTVLLDLEATEKGRYTGLVKGFYLFDININELKTYEGDQEILEKSEYFKFETPNSELIEEFDSPIDEVSFGYADGFKEKIIDRICQDPL